MNIKPELLLIVCEGKTEVLYFDILRKRFRLPAWVKIIPDLNEYSCIGQHEKLVDFAVLKREEYINYGIKNDEIETWAVCDRDDYRNSFSKLRQYAEERCVSLAYSDPQFENYLLQHFSHNKTKSHGQQVIQELSAQLRKTSNMLYNKGDLSWLDEMIDAKHDLVRIAAQNAGTFSNHTKQPFFTIQNLVFRLLELVD